MATRSFTGAEVSALKTWAPDWLYKGTVRTFRASGFRKRQRTIGGKAFSRYLRELT